MRFSHICIRNIPLYLSAFEEVRYYIVVIKCTLVFHLEFLNLNFYYANKASADEIW